MTDDRTWAGSQRQVPAQRGGAGSSGCPAVRPATAAARCRHVSVLLLRVPQLPPRRGLRSCCVATAVGLLMCTHSMDALDARRMPTAEHAVADQERSICCGQVSQDMRRFPDTPLHSGKARAHFVALAMHVHVGAPFVGKLQLHLKLEATQGLRSHCVAAEDAWPSRSSSTRWVTKEIASAASCAARYRGGDT